MAATRTLQPNYIVKFDLSPREITNPPVSRTLSCPADASFYQLHKALQIAFGWATTHAFEFEASRPRPPFPLHPRFQQHPAAAAAAGSAAEAEAEADLPPARPLRIVDPDMDPIDFDFSLPGVPTPPKPTEKKSTRFKLRQFFDDPAYAGYRMVYNYDFGDCWEHEMTLLGRADDFANANIDADIIDVDDDDDAAVTTNFFVCVDGTGHHVAEDVGGPIGWATLKAAYRAERPDAGERQERRWFERTCSNGSVLGLEGRMVDEWPRWRINRVLRGRKVLKNFARLRREQQERRLLEEEEGEEGEMDVD
ncbi:MM3350-like domain-containing protein [Daldinia bambusicola]|nr:MM3350-like domain-containing protein [Daldinia bambusicola]